MTSALRDRAVPALVLGGLALLLAGSRALHEPGWPTDFDQLWHAARALLRGADPYSIVGPRNREFTWLWPLYYPLSAVLAVVPLSWMPIVFARVAFATLASATLGWAMGRRVVQLWPIVLSAAWIIAVTRTQWSPLLLAACWMPALAWAATAKPNIGLATFLAYARRDQVRLGAIAAAAALMASFLARPDWFFSWRAAIADAPHIQAPVTRPLGFLVLLLVFRWRRPEARLVLAMACVPHTPSLYDLLPLFFACRTLRETLALSLLTQVVFWGFIMFGSGVDFDDYAGNLGHAIVWVVYLPLVAAILTRPRQPTDTPVEFHGMRRSAVPQGPVDVTLSAIVIVGAFFLTWLPLVTRR